MTAYELEGLSISEVLPFPLLELNKDLHCSRRNKPWITSRALLHIRTEILKCTSVTFSINYWVSKWWWFVIFPYSLLTIVCFPPKNYVPDLKQRGRRLNIVKQLSDLTVVSVCGKQPFSPWSLCQQQHRVMTLKWPSGNCSTWARAAYSETGQGGRDERTELEPRPCILPGFWNADATQCHNRALPITQPSPKPGAHTNTYQLLLHYSGSKIIDRAIEKIILVSKLISTIQNNWLPLTALGFAAKCFLARGREKLKGRRMRKLW